MMTEVMQPEISGTVCLWLGGTRRCHGNGAPCGSVGSGDRAWVSSFLYVRDNLCLVHQEAARIVVSEDREVHWKGMGVLFLSRGA